MPKGRVCNRDVDTVKNALKSWKAISKGGKKRAKARMEKMTPEEPSEIARRAAIAR